jgi:RNA polymerase sigma factor (sigma-70 family)
MTATKQNRGRGTDATLIARVLNGDQDSYTFLVHRYQDELFRYACGMGLDGDTASDMVQDAFVNAYRRLRECRNRDGFRSWLVRILRNRCLDHLKNVRRKELPLETAAHASADARYDSALELRLALLDAFGTLPPALRDAFLLKHQAGYSYEELAKITRSSVSAAKMRVHRAREALRACLVEHGAEGPRA